MENQIPEMPITNILYFEILDTWTSGNKIGFNTIEIFNEEGE